MNERKNIDRLFQEKFKDFEQIPSDKVWENIEEILNEKKKRKIIPFWLRFSGIAALFLVGVFVLKNNNSLNFIKKQPVVVHENENNKRTNNASKNTISSSSVIDSVSNLQAQENAPLNGIINDKITSDKERNSVVNAENSSLSKRKVGLNSVMKAQSNNVSENLIQNNNETINSNKIANKSLKKGSDKKLEVINSLVKNPELIDKATTLETQNKVVTSKIIETEILKEDKKDTTKVAIVVPNVLEELLNEKESKSKGESKLNRWQLTSNVAPIFLGSISNGSPIDSAFINNGKDYNREIGIGIGVSYAINTKISIRTGINKVSLSYNTNDIAFYPTIGISNMKNINFTNSGAIIHVENNTTPTDNFLPFENSIVQKNQGYINQKIGYLEVPFEITYAIVNRRLGLRVISGISTLFLNDNSISVVSEGISSRLGEANNLNDIHFSTNIGLGVKYGFWKSFEANIEPMFKYQINTFSNNSGNFKPYIFGLYSGISYKF